MNLLHNIKEYVKEQQESIQEQYECTDSDYGLGKLEVVEDILNTIEVEEMMMARVYSGDIDAYDYYYDLYEV